MQTNFEKFDLTQLPDSEDDNYEFKSSNTPPNELKKKLSCAVSGFANSGGGCFIAGVDGSGNADNGLPLKIGRQDLRDWADQVINQVEPVPRYEIKLISDSMGRGVIQPDLTVLLVFIHESYAGPHMAPDNHYYIRAGAHTVKAKHFIVDAIWAKRHFSKPRLTHLFRSKPGKEAAVQLGILALTEAPAVDVTIDIAPLPEMLSDCESLFPLQVALIDRDNPFFFDVVTYYLAKSRFGEDVHLNVEYYDLSGNHYIYSTKIEISGAVPPIIIGDNNSEKLVKAIESMNEVFVKFTKPREKTAKPSLALSKPSEFIFAELENLLPGLLTEMREDLQSEPLARELVLVPRGAQYNGNPNNFVLQYIFEDHPLLRNQLRILENYGLVYDITYNDTPRFVISEELAAYLISDQSEQPY